jgi:hypothetical protein
MFTPHRHKRTPRAEADMTYLISKLYSQELSEAEAFFADTRASRLAGFSITFLAVTNMAATVATLFGQG